MSWIEQLLQMMFLAKNRAQNIRVVDQSSASGAPVEVDGVVYRIGPIDLDAKKVTIEVGQD